MLVANEAYICKSRWRKNLKSICSNHSFRVHCYCVHLKMEAAHKDVGRICNIRKLRPESHKSHTLAMMMTDLMHK